MSSRISQMKDHYISLDQARYATSIVAKYLYTATVTNFPSDMIFDKTRAYTSDEKFEKLSREFNIHYRSCIGSLIYLLSTRVDLSVTVHK